ncbi:MAG: aminotransferase class I/II-fold pyridoxal phosphate-dependent enzyme [Bacteroidales bacterium]|nr:aminotransferase class I/II-fold pyridoxal phosphate-dependent enzyme [Bacteroidales bacterium]
MEYLANRILNLTESATLQMTRRARELKAQGNDIINLSIGEPDFNTPEVIKEGGIQAIRDNYSHYTPVSGLPKLKNAIIEKFKKDNNLEYHPDQIVVSNGAKQSIANAIMCLVNPGEEVIIPAPY